MVSERNLTKNYRDFSLNVTLDISDGQITGLVGKNGAGKTTVIKAMLGLIRPDGGSVTVFGKDASALTTEDKQKIGVALSDSGFSNYLTPADCAKILDKMYDHFDKPAFLKACARYGLPVDKQIRQFSTGMKAKLRVLVAMSHDAKLLIMDEPTAGMDVEARNEVLDIIRTYCDRIAFAHIRNVRRYPNGDFTEASHRDCDGDVRILDIMKAYHDCGFQGYVRPDHGRHIWGEQCRPGYGLYDRALGIMYLWGCWDMLEKTEGKVDA